MHTNLKNRLNWLCLATLLVLGAAGNSYATSSQWEVLLDGMPARLTTGDAGINTSLYILKQTHEPLFRIDDGENYTSKLLQNWSRSVDSRSYVFCPDTTLKFEEGKEFSVSFFSDYISKVAKGFDPAVNITRKENCSRINFKKSHKLFLNYLTLYEHAPTIVKDANTEIGLGAFYPKNVSEKGITLVRKKTVNSGYNSIIIYPYAGPNDKNLGNTNISDYNRIAVSAIPFRVRNEYAHFDSVILKTVVLIINYPDKDVRRVLYNCINIKSFRSAFYPGRSDFLDIQNILPLGIFGAQGGALDQQCVLPNNFNVPKRKLFFVNLGSNNDSQLKSFLAYLGEKTGLMVEVKVYPDKEMFSALFSYPRKYNLTVVAMDAVRPDHAAFFEYLFDKNGYLDFQLPQAQQLYEKLLHEDNPEQKDFLGAKIARLLTEEYVVLPMYQDTRRFYYPKEIKNLAVGRGFLEYPEIADFRW